MTITHPNRGDCRMALDDAAAAILRKVVMYRAQAAGEDIARAESSDELEPALLAAAEGWSMLRAAERGEIQVDVAATVAGHVKRYRADIATDLEHDRAGREKLRAGDHRHVFDPSATVEENLEMYELEVERHERDLRGCDSFLAAVDANAAPSAPTEQSRASQDVAKRHLLRYIAFLRSELQMIPADHALHAELAERLETITARLPRAELVTAPAAS